MNGDEQAIRNLIATWLQATTAGDLPRILKLMDEDIVFLLPGQAPMRGRDAFSRAFEAIPKGARIEPDLEIQEIKILGDWAYCWSRLAIAITPPQGGVPKRQSGHILGIYRKQADGAWTLYRDANLLTPESSEST
jgi:uncharacterized protein (TIGR02246 family)